MNVQVKRGNVYKDYFIFSSKSMDVAADDYVGDDELQLLARHRIAFLPWSFPMTPVLQHTQDSAGRAGCVDCGTTTTATSAAGTTTTPTSSTSSRGT